MCAKGRSLGIDFDFGTNVGNSMDSLRLIYWAGSIAGDAQERLSRVLAHGHFEKRQCVGNHRVLIAAAENCGLDPVRAASVLERGEFEAEVLAQIRKAHEAGHYAIPYLSFWAWRDDALDSTKCPAAGEESASAFGAAAAAADAAASGIAATSGIGGAASPEEYANLLQNLVEKALQCDPTRRA